MAVAVPANAQLEQGRLVGTVTDAQGAVLPGVTVTATSPALIGSQSAVTESDGQFRFPALPSGSYVLQFELSGFQTVRRENIVLALGQTLTVDSQLQIATLQETVTVTSESPVVDLESTKVGSDFSGEKLVGVPSATDLWATLSQAPGVRMQGFDVGGSHKSQQTGYESFGVRGQNRVMTDGVDTTEGQNGAGFYQDFYAHEEISLSAGGGDVTMNSPGAAVVTTIKSGGNSFKSLVNLTWEDESFIADNIDDETAARGFTGQPNLLFYETHYDLGGPVKRDKAWFYVAYNRFKIDKVISGVNRDLATDLGVFNNFTTKGTYKASQKDTIVGYYQWGEKVKPYRGLSATVGPDAILAQDSDSWMYNGQWQRVWSNRLFSEAKVGTFGLSWPMEPAVDWHVNPPRYDLSTLVETGAGWLTSGQGGPTTTERSKPQVTVTSTYFLPDKLGSHDLKFGYEWLNDQSRGIDNGNSGPIQYRDRNGLIDEIRLTDLGEFADLGSGWTGPDNRNMRHAVFFQDRWSATNRMTVTLGVRYDRQRPHYEDSVRSPILTEIFAAQTTARTSLLTSNNVVPRLGVSYDVLGDGKSVLKAYYGRFYYNYADRLANVNPGGTNRRDYKFLDLNGNRLYDGPQELGTLVASAGGTSTTLDPNLKTPYSDEFNLSFERQFWGESSARVAYVRKMVRDQFESGASVFNVAREGQFIVPLTRSVTLQSFDGGIEGVQNFDVFDIPDSLRGVVTNMITNIPDSVGGGDFNYDTIQFAFNKRFGGGLFVQSSFDYQWRDELLTTRQPDNSPLVSDPLRIEYFQNVYPAVSNRQETTTWQARLLGRYLFKHDIGVAANLRVQSGWNYARIISVTLPNAGTSLFFEEDLKNNRSDTAALVDLRFDKAIRFGRYRVIGMLDLFNILNSNAVTNFNLSNGVRFNQINATLDPRTLMLGARFEF